MIEIVNGIIIITLIIIIYKYVEKSNYDIILQKSSINGKEYLVRNLPDSKQEAADMLAKISIKLQKLVDIVQNMGVDAIYDKYMKDDIIKETSGGGSGKKDLIEGQNEEGSSEQKNLEFKIKKKLKGDIERLVKNFNPDAISENAGDTAQFTSYSVNKGEKLVFCIRDKKKGEPIVKENIMTFVIIHECAHLLNESVGHDVSFWSAMKLLLKIAIDNGIYKNIDFNSSPQEYCGINISDNPLK